jgi:hypothetical protein
MEPWSQVLKIGMLLNIYIISPHYAKDFHSTSKFSQTVYRLFFSPHIVRRLTLFFAKFSFSRPLPPTIFSDFSWFFVILVSIFSLPNMLKRRFLFRKKSARPPKEVFQCSENVHRMLREWSEIIPRMLRESSEKFPRNFRTICRHRPSLDPLINPPIFAFKF